MDEMKRKERMLVHDEEMTVRDGCIAVFASWGVMVFIMILVATCSSCTTTRYVEVEKVRTETVHSTDTVERTDTVIDIQKVVVMQVDSAAMAQYGIQLQQNERAWLIQNERLQREINRLREAKADTVIIRDTVPVPFPVEKIVEKRPSFWQQLRSAWHMIIAIAAFIMFIAITGAWYRRRK